MTDSYCVTLHSLCIGSALVAEGATKAKYRASGKILMSSLSSLVTKCSC